MRTTRCLSLLSLMTCAGASTAGAAQVQRYIMTKPMPPSCDEALRNPPQAYAAFSVGEPEAYLWFYVTGLNAGDVIASEYYKPAGGLPVAPSGPFPPVGSAGNWCFTDERLRINGGVPAAHPGEWTVKATLNGAPLFTLKFTIGNATVPLPYSGTQPGGGTTPVAAPNLIRNGDAETGAAASDCSGLANISGWIADGRASVCRYGSGDFLLANAPGPSDRGSNFFAGGSNDRSMIYQVIDVSSSAAQIDAGTLPYTLSGWLGGWADQDDSAKLTATFKSASGEPLAYASIGPVLAAERNRASGLVLKSATGTVPRNARSVVVDLTFTRASGTYNDGYADSLSLAFTSAAPGGGGGAAGAYKLAIDQVDTSACPSVRVNVTVTDASGAPVGGLTASNFTLKEGGQSRPITVTATQTSPFNPAPRYVISYTAANPTADASVEIAVTVGGQTASAAQTVARCASGGGPAPACGFGVPSASSVPGSGGTGTIQVTTAATCSWTASSNASWITLTAGASGTGSGTVGYRAAANPGTTPRTGTLTVAGVTHTVTQAAGSAPCSYSLSPSSASVAASGGTAAVAVSASAGCAWSASSNAAWITVASGASGTGNATVTLNVAANPAASSRTGVLTIAGLTFTVNQAGQPQAGAPAIHKGGVVNAASYISAALPAGAIARGSIFSVLGAGMGPAESVKADYPLPETLAEVSVRVTQGSKSVNAWPVSVSAAKIDAVMPSNAVAGDAQVTVTYRGRTSAPAAIRIASSNFGAFSNANGKGPGVIRNVNSPDDQPLNTRSAAAKPGQSAVLSGTGLGPIDAPDNVAAAAVQLPAEIFVGGKPAKIAYAGRDTCCAGRDRIEFEVPLDAPAGCNIPVQVKAESSYSNVVTMAIEANGQQCQAAGNPVLGIAERGGKVGVVLLARVGASLELEPGKPPTDMTLDLGAGLFQEFAAGGELAYNPLLSYPPRGTCMTYSGDLDLGAILGAGTKAEDTGGLTGRALDAGSQLTVTGPRGAPIPLPKADEEATTGPYAGLLGGTLPIGDGPSLPPFLDGGQYTVKGTGGKDVGPVSVSLDGPHGVDWTGRNRIRQVDRNSGVTFNWSGGGSSQIVLLGGASTDQKNQVAAGFFCSAVAAQGSFTVPPNVLANLPASIGENAEQTLGALLVGTMPDVPFQTFSASGLDTGLALYFLVNVTTVPYK
jgi:uncharacterized protein (TIGR03437 family)